MSSSSPKATKSFLDSLEEQPFKIVVQLNTLVLVYLYVAVVISTLWLEPTDLGVPLKGVYLTAISSDSILIANDFYLAAKNQNIALIWEHGGRMLFQVLFLVTSLSTLSSFLFSNIGIGDLRSLDVYAKSAMTLAILSVTLFTIGPAIEALSVLSKRVGGVADKPR